MCFKPLLRALGVRESFGAADYLHTLRRLHDASSSSEGCSSSGDVVSRSSASAGCDGSSSVPLEPQPLALALWMVQQLADMTLPTDGEEVVYCVDADNRLAPAGSLVYNDAPWLETTTTNSQEAHLAARVHPKLSHEVAERVGVRSLRRLLLARSAHSVDLGVAAAEAFGQHESLTTRLKHIIDAYADGPGILYELIQNADDAGATEVRLLLDTVPYGSSSLMGPRMAHWQGPSLLAYNDATFTPADLRNIARIGQVRRPGRTLSQI